ncbi:hypothetical protein ABU952_07045 [Bacillus amyloliquefaciens]
MKRDLRRIVTGLCSVLMQHNPASHNGYWFASRHAAKRCNVSVSFPNVF